MNKIIVCNGVEKSRKLIHDSKLLIELTTDGEGVRILNIVENDYGRLLHVESSASNSAYDVYEVDGDELKSKLYWQQSHEEPDVENFWYCPGTSFYAVSKSSGTILTINNSLF